jgi:hypothetical protein
MRVPRSLISRGLRLARTTIATAAVLAAAAVTGQPVPPPGAAPVPITILDLQPFRTESAVEVQGPDGASGTAVLTNLNPNVNAWFLLALDFGATRPRQTYHLENARPDQMLSLAAGPRGRLFVTFGDRSAACSLAIADGPGGTSLESARKSGLPFAPMCDGRLYLRNPTVGRASTLEKVTGFLRDHVWGGEQFVEFVKKELYQEAFREQGAPAVEVSAWAAPEAAPAAALVDSSQAELAVAPPHLGLDVDAPGPRLLLGRWYALRGIPDAYFSVLMPEAVDRNILLGHEASVSPLTGAESSALVYLVAFDLARFELRFTLGTDHPRLGWSPRPPPESYDPQLPGPDGIDSPAPLVITGMVPPMDGARTVAAFAGGFKREHGAFRFGALAERNHGSHYGFVEQGVVFSKLQPGLATVSTTVSGEVRMDTWTVADGARMASIRDARQNGVPLIDYDARRNVGVPGALVNVWGEGNWSGSANEDLRTVRAGLCLQDTRDRRFLVFAYFSSASPSAMARVLQAYRCRYAMHLDMNALEHTYFAAYVSLGGRRTVEHLIDGMDVLDRQAGGALAPRFVGFPDNRDFFYLTRRAGP